MGYCGADPHNACICHFVVVSDVNNGVNSTPAANNEHDDVTELLVTSQLFGML